MLKTSPRKRAKKTIWVRFSPTQMVLRPIKKNAKVQALIVAAVAWSLAWKGASMWRAAKNDSKPWFVTLLAVNSMGILDSFYIFVVDRRSHLREREINSLYAEADQEQQEDLT